MNEDKYIEVLCQQCGKNKVKILKNKPYFGILCAECLSLNKAYRYEK